MPLFATFGPGSRTLTDGQTLKMTPSHGATQHFHHLLPASCCLAASAIFGHRRSIACVSLPSADSTARATTIMSHPIVVKWGKETVEVNLVPTGGVKALKAELEEKTGVPQDRQKIMPKSKGELS